MMDLTTNIVKHLDLARRLGIGVNATCIPLIHSVGHGYEALSIALPGGWSLEDADSDINQQLVIAEQDWVDSDLLNKTNAFSIEGLVYKINGLHLSGPSANAAMREWKFTVAPTGEAFAV